MVHISNWWFWGGSAAEFLLFVTVWSILILLYVGVSPVVAPSIHVPIAAFALLGITMIFWFAGATALAARFGVPDCNGSGFCQTTQASIAFAYFLWAGFTGLFAIEALAFWKSRGPAAHPDKV